MSAPRPRLGLRWLPSIGVLGSVLLWCWWQIRSLGDVRLHLTTFYGWFGLAFLAYLAALWLVQRAEQDGSAPRLRWVLLGWILAVAVICRGFLLGTVPTLSDDIYRYRWDGWVQRAGLDPYAYPPAHPRLAFLRDPEFHRVNFPELRTVYPPVTELAFRLGVALGETLTAQKLVFVSAEAVLALSLWGLLLQRGRSPLWLVAYLWHPLPMLEVAGSGHNDALGIACLWLGLWAWGAGWRMGSALAWAGAFLSKFASAVLVPWWWFRRTARRWLGLLCVLAALPLALHPAAVRALVESLSAVTMRFESNASVYLLVVRLLGDAGLARAVSIGAWLAWLLWWARREADPIRYVLGGFGAAALLSPALHPWYLVWLVPCFCFWRMPALVALTGTAVLSYTVWPGRLADGSWVIPVWARALEYAPVLLLGLWSLRRLFVRRGPTPSSFLHTGAPGMTADVASHTVQHTAHSTQHTGRRVAVIIPARNEAAALPRVLADIPHELVHEVIVVDNGSTDGTADAGRAAGARVVSEPTPGYGRACLAGVAALQASTDTLVFMDGDHSDDPEDLPRLLEPIARGEADLVIGSRVARAQPGSLTVPQRLGNRLACALMQRMFGFRYTDLGPFRAIRRDALERLQMRDRAFGWTVEMQAKAIRQGLRIVEVPVRYRPRIGRSKISGTLTGTLRAGFAILATILRIAVAPQTSSDHTQHPAASRSTFLE